MLIVAQANYCNQVSFSRSAGLVPMSAIWRRKFCPSATAPGRSAIPGLRDDPKIVGRDDTKVVGDSVAKAVPFFGNSSPKEAQDCRSELGEGFIASIIGDMFVHHAPASFDRIKMRTIGRDEVQPDPASRLPQPLTH